MRNHDNLQLVHHAFLMYKKGCLCYRRKLEPKQLKCAMRSQLKRGWTFSIASRGESCVCELTDALHTGQSRLSFHLKILRDAGLIYDRPKGRWIYYTINSDAVEELENLVAWLKTMRKTVRPSPRR
jgi:DNA-binding transcriptional ArsR family regulator